MHVRYESVKIKVSRKLLEDSHIDPENLIAYLAQRAARRRFPNDICVFKGAQKLDRTAEEFMRDTEDGLVRFRADMDIYIDSP